MEIIEELEPVRRGVYGGAVLYADYAGNLDSCIAIRTMVVHRGRAYVQAGAGMVADSDPEKRISGVHEQGEGAAASRRESRVIPGLGTRGWGGRSQNPRKFCISGYGKLLLRQGNESGHDFSRAAKVQPIISVADGRFQRPSATS